MPKVTISEAARLACVPRSTIYRKIKSGEMSIERQLLWPVGDNYFVRLIAYHGGLSFSSFLEEAWPSPNSRLESTCQ